ncbi:hypothetical protein G9A89_023068 [Geosiphon pyriformis]|nr:hypothetical protein G9A89_023068 [Geosiphon pyriformis]
MGPQEDLNKNECYTVKMRQKLRPSLNVYSMVMTAEKAIFQEYNAPIHKCEFVKALQNDFGIVTLEWPPQSPDISPIHKSRKPRTEADLE